MLRSILLQTNTESSYLLLKFKRMFNCQNKPILLLTTESKIYSLYTYIGMRRIDWKMSNSSIHKAN